MLTHLQKTALTGELALALTKATHKDDLLFRIYIILKSIVEGREEAIKIVQDFIELPDEDFVRVYLAASQEKFATWIWANKTLGDIKFSLNYTPSETPNFVGVDKTKAKKEIIRSAFINFARKVGMTSAIAIAELIKRILEDEELEFLHKDSLIFLGDLSELEDTDENVNPKVANIGFNINDILSYESEIKVMEYLNSAEREGDLATIEIRDNINKELEEALNNKNNKIKYCVKKVYTGSQRETTIKIFGSKEEAYEFVEGIKKQFPEIESTCNFVVQETQLE